MLRLWVRSIDVAFLANGAVDGAAVCLPQNCGWTFELLLVVDC